MTKQTLSSRIWQALFTIAILIVVGVIAYIIVAPILAITRI